MRPITYSRLVVAIVILAAILIISASIRSRDRTLDVRRELQQPSGTNAAATSQQATRTYQAVGSRPLYGEASLSAEEKRLLYKPFDGMWVRGEGALGTMVLDGSRTLPRAYQVGMVCLKHRLNWSEVQSLITGKIPKLQNPTGEIGLFWLRYASPGAEMFFEFDPKGNLQRVGMPHTWYKFPPPEEVTPDTSIEPPPKPAGWED